MSKIAVPGTLVVADGDEMARVVWQIVSDRLIYPHLELDIAYFDLSLENRDLTRDRVTADAGRAVLDHGVGVKCPTAVSGPQNVLDHDLSGPGGDATATLRRLLGGAVLREPIRLDPADPAPRVVLAVPADAQDSVDARELTARVVLAYALSGPIPVRVSAAEAASDLQRVYDAEFADRFAEAGIGLQTRPGDEIAALAREAPERFVWVLPDANAAAGAELPGLVPPGLLSSVQIGRGGAVLAEPGHGTVAAHFKHHQEGEDTSTNPVALITAWTMALTQRGLRDGAPEVVAFAEQLDDAVRETIASGHRTADLAAADAAETTQQVLEAIGARLRARLER